MILIEDKSAKAAAQLLELVVKVFGCSEIDLVQNITIDNLYLLKSQIDVKECYNDNKQAIDQFIKDAK